MRMGVLFLAQRRGGASAVVAVKILARLAWRLAPLAIAAGIHTAKRRECPSRTLTSLESGYAGCDRSRSWCRTRSPAQQQLSFGAVARDAQDSNSPLSSPCRDLGVRWELVGSRTDAEVARREGERVDVCRALLLQH